MCGLAGFCNLWQSSFNLDSTLLEAMQQTIEHRGPDGYRTWVCPEMELGLVHRRLSIVDLSKAAFQPLFDQEQSIAVMCNGEIYNHLALRSELEARGHVFKTHSDTEVIVYAYKEWGIDCIKRLNGMFAIIIVDRKKQELYLVRDRIGIKPLYFSNQSGVLSFASEIKALWKLPWITKRLNQRGLYHYLTYMVTPAPMTLYEGVYKLPAGFFAKLDAQKNLTFHEWYNPAAQVPDIPKKQQYSESFWIKKIRETLRASVKKRLMADVPYGAFLSGGIDSSLIVALMSEMTDNVKTFNVSFEDGPEYSEIMWARKVARKFNTDHHEIIISEKEAFEFFEKMVHHQDEPIADCVCIPLYYVSKLLKDSGVTVALVGEGSDELFCGYSSYAKYIDFYNRYWKPSQQLVPAVAKKGIYLAAKKIYPNRFNRLDILSNWAHDRNLFWGGATAFGEIWKHTFIQDTTFEQNDTIIEAIMQGFNQQQDSHAIVDYHLKNFSKLYPKKDFLNSIVYLELKQRLPELLLMRVDKMTMATSVEARVPFLDHSLVELAFSIPSSLKYNKRQTKYILKKVSEGIIPHDIIYRKKVGFAAPTSRWFKEGNYFKPYFMDMLNSKRKEWNQHINIKAVEQLFSLTQQPNIDYSTQLWVIQNVMASDAL